MKCPNCSFDNLPDAPFCENCGEVFLPGDLIDDEVAEPEVEIIDFDEAPSSSAPTQAARTPSAREALLSDVPSVVNVPHVISPVVSEDDDDDDLLIVDAVVTTAATSTSSASKPAREVEDPDATRPVDLPDYERMVDGAYRPPENDRVHAGDTAEIPVIEDDGYVPQARNYTVGLTERERRQREREQRRMAKKFAKYQQKEEERLGVGASFALTPEDESAVTGALPVIMLDDDGNELPGSEEPLYTEAAVTTVHNSQTDTVKDGNAKTARTAFVSPKQAKKGKADSPKGSAAAYARNHRVPWKTIVFVVAVVLLLLAAAGAVWFTYDAELWGGKTVPDVVGLSQDEATAALVESGFFAEVAEEKSDIAAGTVLGCDPEQGTRAPEGSAITLVVAAPRLVPSVVGLTQQQALEALAAEGLAAVEITEQKSSEVEGTVLFVSPEESTEVLSSNTIALTVAVPYTVPAVEGLTADEARAALEAEGYAVTSKWTYAEDVKEGFALRTDPPAGTQLDTGSEVTLYIAKSRANEVIALARKALDGADIKTDSGSFTVENIKNVSYQGDNTVSYTVEARQYETRELPFDLGTETYYDKKLTAIEGTITFNSDDEMSDSSPTLRK